MVLSRISLLVLPAAVLGMAALGTPLTASAAAQDVHVQPVEVQSAASPKTGTAAAAKTAESQQTVQERSQGQTVQPVKKMKRVQARERTPAYRGGSFLLQREQHYSSEELLRLTLSPQA